MDDMISGRYRLEERLGTGGMAQVWLAHDVQLDRRVAVKLLGAEADPQRFEREAQAVASLSHPNICRVYDYGSTEGRPYMVFEHLAGGTLEDRLAGGRPLDDAESERIAADVAAGTSSSTKKAARRSPTSESPACPTKTRSPTPGRSWAPRRTCRPSRRRGNR
jgi:eukaryotic-like serine/threonine-protein kinase